MIAEFPNFGLLIRANHCCSIDFSKAASIVSIWSESVTSSCMSPRVQIRRSPVLVTFEESKSAIQWERMTLIDHFSKDGNSYLCAIAANDINRVISTMFGSSWSRISSGLQIRSVKGVTLAVESHLA